MKNLFLILFSVFSLSCYAQQDQFKVLEPITFTGINAQTVLDSISFEAGDLVTYKESFGVLVIEKEGITVRTDYKFLKKLEDEGKIKLPEKMVAARTPLTKEENLLRKINNKLNFLVGAIIVSAGAGIISLVSLLRSE